MGLFSKKIVYGIKGVGLETKKLGKPTKEVALHTKKIIEHTYTDSKGRPTSPKLNQIKDTGKYSNPLSKNIYVRPQGFVNFEGGQSKISSKPYNTPKSYIKFTDMF